MHAEGVTVDVGTPPLPLGTPAPAATARTPGFSGAAGTAPRDSRWVSVEVWKGTTIPRYDYEDPDGYEARYKADYVGYVDFPEDSRGNVSGGRFSGDVLKKHDWDSDSEAKLVGDLPNGTYIARAEQCDTLYNCAEVDRVFTVGDAPAPAGETTPAPAAPATPRELAQRLLQSALGSLKAKGIAKLLKGTSVQAAAEGPGVAEIQIFRNAAPKKVQPVATTAAAKKRKAA